MVPQSCCPYINPILGIADFVYPGVGWLALVALTTTPSGYRVLLGLILGGFIDPSIFSILLGVPRVDDWAVRIRKSTNEQKENATNLGIHLRRSIMQSLCHPARKLFLKQFGYITI